MRWTRSRASEEGSEVVSTVLVQGLVVLVILLLAQLAFASHVRTMSVSAASEGARRGGLLREISVDRESDAGVDILTVTVRTRLPLVGGLGPRWLTVRGRALVEGP